MALLSMVAGLALAKLGEEYSVAFRPNQITVEQAARFGKVISRENDYYVLELGAERALRLRKDAKRVASVRRRADEPNRNSVRSLSRYMDARHAEERAAKRNFGGLGNDDNHLWYVQMRAYPKDTVDWSRYNEATKQRDQMPRPDVGMSDASFWSYAGPWNLDVVQRQFFGLRPTNGKITAAVSHPTDMQIAYVGSPMGGVWKTTDSGVNWSPLSEDWSLMGVSSLAINVINPDFVYAGTGDYDGGLDYGHGIMVSDDAGSTWTESGAADFGSMPVSAITVDPELPTVVMATTASRNSSGSGYLWRNTLGALFGAWSKPIGIAAKWMDVKYGTFDPQISARRYYAIGSSATTNYFYMSTDRGQTWVQRNLPNGLAQQDRMNIATSKLFPQVIYLLATNAQKIFKSTNAGSSWTDITAGFPNGNAQLGSTYNWSQSTFYNSDIETSSISNDADVVYVGLIDIARSPDGGASWSSVGGRTYETDAQTHNDQHVISNTADPDFMLVGNDGGAYHYTRGGGTDVWFYRSRNLGVVQFYHSDHHPSSLTKMIGGSQDNATPFANGDIANWGNAGGGDGGGCAIDPSNPNVQYATSQRYSFDATTGTAEIFQTTAAWANTYRFPFSPGLDNLPTIGVYELDPNLPLVGYFGTNFLWRFIYSGAPGFGIFNARVGNTLLAPGGGTITAISVCKADSNVIYTGSSSGEIFMTRNGGSTAFQNITTNLPDRAIADVSVNPEDPNDVLVVLSGFGSSHVYHCEDTSAVIPNWVAANGSGLGTLPDAPANTIVRSIYDPETTWWLGTDIGTFLTASEGSGWLNVTGLGMPNVQVNDLTFAEGSSRIWAATFGRGMWHIEVFPPNEEITGADSPSSATAGTAFPITITLDHPAPDTGTTVQLSSNNAMIVPPSQVYIPFNQTQRQFMIPTRVGSLSTVTGVLTATLLNSVKTMVVTLNPPGGLFAANLMVVPEGELFTGSVSDLQAYGGGSVSIFSDPVTLGGRIELRGASPVAVPATMSFVWAGSTDRLGLIESVQMLDVTTGSWVQVAGRIGAITNAYGLVPSVPSPARFVGGNSNARAALSWEPLNDEDPTQDGWLQHLDFALWRVTP